MTIPRRDGGDTPFSAWIRSQPELDSRLGYDLEDFDRLHSRLYTLHQFLHGELMLIEEKQYNAEQSFAQIDTMSVLSQALRQGFSDPALILKRRISTRPTKITYFGYHLIQFEKSGPKDGYIRIGGIRVTEQELLRFLQFDRQFMQERLRFNPQTITLSELAAYRPSQRVKRRNHSIVPTLFNPTPIQQQKIWGEA